MKFDILANACIFWLAFLQSLETCSSKFNLFKVKCEIVFKNLQNISEMVQKVETVYFDKFDEFVDGDVKFSEICKIYHIRDVM